MRVCLFRVNSVPTGNPDVNEPVVLVPDGVDATARGRQLGRRASAKRWLRPSGGTATTVCAGTESG
jgi:hypothetical protein